MVDIQDLQRRVKLQEEKLELTVTIDYIRDKNNDLTTMLSQLATLLTLQFRAETCLICLANHETGELELKAVSERGTPPDLLAGVIDRELAGRVLRLDQTATWHGDAVPETLRRVYPDDDVYLIVSPIIIDATDRLGAILVARKRTPFGADEIEVFTFAEDLIDSAVVQGYTYHELQQRNKELETVYRIDQIRDRNLKFDDMLTEVLQELRQVIQAEMGFIMLYDQSGNQLELRAATTEDDLFRTMSFYSVLEATAHRALAEAAAIRDNNPANGLRSVMCIPLILNNRIIGVLGVVNAYRSGGFNLSDHRLLNAIASQIDTAIFESNEKRKLRKVLGRSVDPHVMERLLENPNVDFLRGERMVLTVLYSDLRGSTRMTERTDPELMVGFVNDYLGRMTEVILSYEGTLDKFVGDEVMALFGAPCAQGDHALRAVTVGLEMQKAHQGVMNDWRMRGVEPAPMGIGIATGELTVGEMGCQQRTDYTVIGPAANLGARICATAGPGQVLISRETYEMVKDQIRVEPVPGVSLKGVGEVTLYEVRRMLAQVDKAALPATS